MKFFKKIKQKAKGRKLKKERKEEKKIQQQILANKEIIIGVNIDGVQVESKGLTEEKAEDLLGRIIKKHGRFIVFKKKNKSLGF